MIEQVLAWRSDEGESFKDHIIHELGKLKKKVRKSPHFEEHYKERAEQIPSTVIAKLDDCVDLLNKWSDNPDAIITPRDKTIISDMLEFVVVPFYKFGHSASDTLGKMENVLQEHCGDAAVYVNTVKKLQQNVPEYHRLGNVLVRLCEMLDYPIPRTVKLSLSTPNTPGF